MARPDGSKRGSKRGDTRSQTTVFQAQHTSVAVCRACGQRPDQQLCWHADHVASTRATEQRKVLGDHEQHEVQRLSRQHSSGAQRSPKTGRGASRSSSSGQALLSVIAVALVFCAVMFWSVKLLMPKEG